MHVFACVYELLHTGASMLYIQPCDTHAFPLFTLLCTCHAYADFPCAFACLHSHPHIQLELHSLFGCLQNKAYTLQKMLRFVHLGSFQTMEKMSL